MDHLKISHLLLNIALVLLFLIGCSTPTAEPVPDTPTSPVLITNAETLVGNWQPLSKSIDAMFLQFNSDGSCRNAYLFDGLIDVPEVECTYSYEGTNLLITAVKLNGVPDCPNPTAKYEVHLLEENLIKFDSIKDSCIPRVRSTQGEYQHIP